MSDWRPVIFLFGHHRLEMWPKFFGWAKDSLEELLGWNFCFMGLNSKLFLSFASDLLFTALIKSIKTVNKLAFKKTTQYHTIHRSFVLHIQMYCSPIKTIELPLQWISFQLGFSSAQFHSAIKSSLNANILAGLLSGSAGQISQWLKTIQQKRRSDFVQWINSG